ncbi:hypothetical protein [Haloarchaeobius sp. TZWWS8]|uniref:hypothetical protein n=1 Tax=Haloarchaeobius sp. TZWWS8 TaxID=3446121 RepID=UPI003EBCDFC0
MELSVDAVSRPSLVRVRCFAAAEVEPVDAEFDDRPELVDRAEEPVEPVLEAREVDPDVREPDEDVLERDDDVPERDDRLLDRVELVLVFPSLREVVREPDVERDVDELPLEEPFFPRFQMSPEGKLIFRLWT